MRLLPTSLASARNHAFRILLRLVRASPARLIPRLAKYAIPSLIEYQNASRCDSSRLHREGEQNEASEGTAVSPLSASLHQRKVIGEPGVSFIS